MWLASMEVSWWAGDTAGGLVRERSLVGVVGGEEKREYHWGVNVG